METAEQKVNEARRLVAMAQSKLGAAKASVLSAKRRAKKTKTKTSTTPKKRKRRTKKK